MTYPDQLAILQASDPALGGAVAGLRTDASLVQFLFGGRQYCWYEYGWQGPGWYWCGYERRRGYGWGGGYGWHGARGGHPGAGRGVGHGAAHSGRGSIGSAPGAAVRSRGALPAGPAHPASRSTAPQGRAGGMQSHATTMRGSSGAGRAAGVGRNAAQGLDAAADAPSPECPAGRRPWSTGAGSQGRVRQWGYAVPGSHGPALRRHVPHSASGRPGTLPTKITLALGTTHARACAAGKSADSPRRCVCHALPVTTARPGLPHGPGHPRAGQFVQLTDRGKKSESA